MGFGNVPSGFCKAGSRFLMSYLNRERELANQTSIDCSSEVNSFPAFLKRIGVSKVEALCPMRIVRTCLFVVFLAMFIDCER